MNHPAVSSQIEGVVAQYDLLQHPFYQAWTAGELRREDLALYAREYYHHVAAFPAYLSALHARLPDGELRRAVLRNLCEEEITGAAHSELWLDFAEGMGAARDEVRAGAPLPSTAELVRRFREMAAGRRPAAAMAAFYAYESQVARIAGLKAESLRACYGADEKSCAYFTLHAGMDAHHARAWAGQIERELGAGNATEAEVLDAARDAAAALWASMDGIHAARR